MQKIILSIFLALVMLVACEKEAAGPMPDAEKGNAELTVLKSANITKNDAITDDILESVYGYFEGLEMKDNDLLRSLAHEDFIALEQGVYCDGVEEHIAWFESLGMPPVGVYNFDLEIKEVYVKGNVAWVIFYDHLYIGGANVWNGLESATLMKTNGKWLWMMMTVTQLDPCAGCDCP